MDDQFRKEIVRLGEVVTAALKDESPGTAKLANEVRLIQRYCRGIVEMHDRMGEADARNGREQRVEDTLAEIRVVLRSSATGPQVKQAVSTLTKLVGTLPTRGDHEEGVDHVAGVVIDRTKGIRRGLQELSDVCRGLFDGQAQQLGDQLAHLQQWTEGQQETLWGGIRDVHQEIEVGSERVQESLDDVHQAVSRLDDTVDAGLIMVHAAVDGATDNIRAEIGNEMAERFEDLQENFEEVDENIQSLRDEVSSMDLRFGAVNDVLARHEADGARAAEQTVEHRNQVRDRLGRTADEIAAVRQGVDAVSQNLVDMRQSQRNSHAFLDAALQAGEQQTRDAERRLGVLIDERGGQGIAHFDQSFEAGLIEIARLVRQHSSVADVGRLRGTLDRIENDLRTQNVEMRASIEGLTRVRDDSAARNQTLSQEKAAMETQRDASVARVQELEREKAAAEVERDASVTRAQELEREKGQAEAERDASGARNAGLLQEVAELRTDLEAGDHARIGEQARHEQLVNELDDRAAQLREVVRLRTEERDAAQEEVDEVWWQGNLATEAAREDANAARGEAEEAREQTITIREESQQLTLAANEEAAEAKTYAEGLNDLLAESRQNAVRLQKDNEKLSTARQALDGQLAEKQQAIERLQAEVADLNGPLPLPTPGSRKWPRSGESHEPSELSRGLGALVEGLETVHFAKRLRGPGLYPPMAAELVFYLYQDDFLANFVKFWELGHVDQWICICEVQQRAERSCHFMDGKRCAVHKDTCLLLRICQEEGSRRLDMHSY